MENRTRICIDENPVVFDAVRDDIGRGWPNRVQAAAFLLSCHDLAAVSECTEDAGRGIIEAMGIDYIDDSADDVEAAYDAAQNMREDVIAYVAKLLKE